jgi:hypothetical protein
LSAFSQALGASTWKAHLLASKASFVLTSAKALEMDSSVIAAVKPAPVNRRVLSTFADVPLNARCLIVGQVAGTARQEHQRPANERDFDDGAHARDPPAS